MCKCSSVIPRPSPGAQAVPVMFDPFVSLPPMPPSATSMHSRELAAVELYEEALLQKREQRRHDKAMPSITKTVILDPAVALGLSPAAAAVFSRGTKSHMKNIHKHHPTTFDIAQRFPPELHQAILLRDEGLTALPGRSWDALLGITAMDISGNHLTALPPGLVALAPTLQSLNVSQNDLQAFPAGLAGLDNLESLNLRANKLGELPDLRGLHHLTSLDVSDNALQELGWWTKEMWRLRRLDVRYNQLRGLPARMEELHPLRELLLSFNFILRIDPAFHTHRGLETLELKCNRLKRFECFPGESFFPSLTALDVAGNALTELPSNLARIGGLLRLAADGNLLSVFPPPSAGGLAQLRSLSLSNNRLVALPEGLEGCGELEELHLDNNRLTRLPFALTRMPRLKSISVHGNKEMHTPPVHVSYGGVRAVCEYLEAAKKAQTTRTGRGEEAVDGGRESAGSGRVLPEVGVRGKGSRGRDERGREVEGRDEQDGRAGSRGRASIGGSRAGRRRKSIFET